MAHSKKPFPTPKAPKARHAPKAPKLLHSRNVAGTTPRHHAAAVSRALKTVHTPGANVGPSGVPVGNPAPGPANAFE